MLILASASPRRRELMEKLHIPFETEASRVEETIPEGLSVPEIPICLARLKAFDVFKRRSEAAYGGCNDIVIGSDTIVACGDEVLGKPKTCEEAFLMLKRLSGGRHEVITGVSIISCDREESFSETCEVEFYPLSDEEIRAYIATGEPMDKAGAYGIQGDGALFVKGIRGDFYTVMGFPIAELARKLKFFKI